MLEVTFEALTYGGAALARANGFVLFTKYGAPGDVARVRVTSAKKNHGEADLLEVLRPAATRVAPPCSLFGTCGGCSWQHLTMQEQERWKERIIHDSLRPLPDAASVRVHPLVASPRSWRYRNKLEFTFARSERGAGPLVCGFHKPANWREILDVPQCHLAPEPVERMLRAAVAEGERQKATAWSPHVHHGTLRQLVFRACEAEDTFLASLLTGDRAVDFEAFAAALFAAEPRLRGVTWGLNSGVSDIARASDVLATVGDTYFEERLGDLRFRVSMASFFQTNTRGAERLYEVAREALELTGREQLLDAYCGTGTIGIFCASRARQVYGIEVVQEAIWDARENAQRNGLRNCTFLAGDMAQALPLLLNGVEGRIDRLLVDPPRGGMEKRAVEQLVALRAPVMVYVSCNPTTMARDLALALEKGYVLEEVTPVDMFPQTYHVECVAKLRLRSS